MEIQQLPVQFYSKRREGHFKPEIKALAVLLYGMCKCSYGMIAKLVNTSRKTVYWWIRDAGKAIEEPKIPQEVTDIEFDEMWHFIKAKKTNYGSGKQWTVLCGKLLPGLSAIVTLKRSGQLYKKVNHLNATYYTDDWEVYS